MVNNYTKQVLKISSWIIIGLIIYLWVKFIYFDSASTGNKIQTQVKPITSTFQSNRTSGSVANYHIFGKSEQQNTSKSTSKTQDHSSLNISLNGTMSSKDHQSGLAFISDSQGVQKKFKVGDEIFKLATLKEIHKIHVIISNNGKHERLSLPDNSQVSRKGVVKSSNKVKKPAYLKHLNGVEQRSWQEMMAQQQFDPNKISSIVGNMNMVVDQAGDINGIRVSNLAQGSLLSSHGLESNDVITAINGKNVSSKNMMTIQETLQKDPNAIISIKRNGRIQNIKINLSDL